MIKRIFRRISRNQRLRFLLVGGFNTAFDFAILNGIFYLSPIGSIETDGGVKIGLIVANLISTTLAMLLSFILNQTYVFNHDEKPSLRKLIIFLAGTAFGLYVLQTVIISGIVHGSDSGTIFTRLAELVPLLDADFVLNNGAKAVATIVTLVWNYLYYKKFVFPANFTEDEEEISNDE